jgi:hypothetical protein
MFLKRLLQATKMLWVRTYLPSMGQDLVTILRQLRKVSRGSREMRREAVGIE